MNKVNNASSLGDRLGYNPYRDSQGRFDDGPSVSGIGRPMISPEDNKKKIEAAKKQVQADLKKKKQFDAARDMQLAKEAKQLGISIEQYQAQRQARMTGNIGYIQAEEKIQEQQQKKNSKPQEQPKQDSTPVAPEQPKTDSEDLKDNNSKTLNLSGKEAIDYSKSQEVNLSDEEKTIVESYQTIYYDMLNSYARKGASEYSKQFKGKADLTAKEAKEWSAKLDSAIAKNKTKEDMYVYRVVASNSITSADDLRLVQDKGYMSTTVDGEGLEAIIGDLGGGKDNIYVLRIEVPKGANGLFIDSATGAEYNEGEFLLPRDTELSIGEAREDKIGKKDVTFLEAKVG